MHKNKNNNINNNNEWKCINVLKKKNNINNKEKLIKVQWIFN